jgi:hypothetical protein
VCAHLQARLATTRGFASYVELQQWLREDFGLEVPYPTLHGLVRYHLQARLTRPRPSQAKKTSPRRVTLSHSARATSGPSPR